MTFKTTLKKAIKSAEAVFIGIGGGLAPLMSMWADPRGEEALNMLTTAGELEAHDQEIEVDANGCAIFEDINGVKHALQASVLRALAVEDVESDDEADMPEVPDGALVH